MDLKSRLLQELRARLFPKPSSSNGTPPIKNPIREAVDRVFLTEAAKITASLLENEALRGRIAVRIRALIEDHVQELGEVEGEALPTRGPMRAPTEDERKQTAGWRAQRMRE